ncbi:glucosaminidase domain-containing protein [Arcobacteraceae bacterium]|nr:glucosaminidase domain-containing protein [Arcobacteraceae bacterium]
MRYRRITFILIFIVLLTGYGDSKIKVLEEKFLNTKLGQIENKKLIVTISNKDEVTFMNKDKPISVSEKKQRFIDILVPISTLVFNQLEAQYKSVKSDIENNSNREYIELLKIEYKAKTDQTLLHALKPHPISILLAQAATESAWLTSRFTKEAYNIFGVWSFNKNEPRIEASGSRGSKTIYLKKYKTLRASVEDYYKNIGRSWAYLEFRKQRTITNNPYVLTDYLGSYSEKKEVYTKLLKSMIKYNEFYIYDIKSNLK